VSARVYAREVSSGRVSFNLADGGAGGRTRGVDPTPRTWTCPWGPRVDRARASTRRARSPPRDGAGTNGDAERGASDARPLRGARPAATRTARRCRLSRWHAPGRTPWEQRRRSRAGHRRICRPAPLWEQEKGFVTKNIDSRPIGWLIMGTTLRVSNTIEMKP